MRRCNKTQGGEENYPKKGDDNDNGLTHKDLSGVEITEPPAQDVVLVGNFVKDKVEVS